MSHHADELRWLSEPDLFAIVKWLDRHLAETVEEKQDQERTHNVALRDMYGAQYRILYRLRHEAATLLAELEASHD